MEIEERQPRQRCFPSASHSIARVDGCLLHPWKQIPVLFCPLAFPSDFFIELNIVVSFCSNSSCFGKQRCVCVHAHTHTHTLACSAVHTDSTINVDVNFGVNFGSWLVLTLPVRLMAFMGTIKINVNIIMFLLSVVVTLNQGPPKRKKYVYGQIDNAFPYRRCYSARKWHLRAES